MADFLYAGIWSACIVAFLTGDYRLLWLAGWCAVGWALIP